MSFDEDKLDALIRSKSAILSLLSKDKYDYPMLIHSKVVPTTWDKHATTLNYYFLSHGNFNYKDNTFGLNCRADTYIKSYRLGKTVYEEINRTMTDAGFYAEILEPIKPQSDQDNWNTPVTVNIKGR